MIVRPASRILSAISFGVFWRSAPSTSLIIRSMKVEPGAAVMRTLIQSDSTWVPPVTAERSPPDSRMTGADSPVIAASFTEAMPSTTSPSDGIVSPASTTTTSPTLRLVPAPLRKFPPPAPPCAAPPRPRLRQVGEHPGDPQPQDDLEFKAEVRASGHDVPDQYDG